MFNRNLRTRFDLLKPNVKDTVQKNQYDQQRFKSTKMHKFFENDIVYVKDYRKDTANRTKAIVIEVISPVT